jgi:hypothetical protein
VGPAGIDVGTHVVVEKSSLNCNFYGRSTFSVQQLDDGWVQYEGYGGPELGEKNFQLSSL